MGANKKKQQYLWEYRKRKRKVDRLNSQIETLRGSVAYSTTIVDGMPKGTGVKDNLPGYVTDHKELAEELRVEESIMKDAFSRITKSIEALNCDNEKDVLNYRYIVGIEPPEIARKMDYSENWVWKIHKKGFENIKIIKSVQ